MFKILCPVQLAILVAASLLTLTAVGEELDSDTIVASLGEASIELRDLDAMVEQLPPELRQGMFGSPQRIGKTLQTMLVRRAIVQDLIANPTKNDLPLEQITASETRRVLANLELEEKINEYPDPDYQQLARDYYNEHPEEFSLPERVSVTHLLIKTEDRAEEQALTLTTQLKAQVVNGELTFDEAVSQWSEDPAKNRNRGKYIEVLPGRTDDAFEKAAFSMTQPGTISEPVKTQFGYHLIRLDERHPAKIQPFDAVAGKIAPGIAKAFIADRKIDILSRYEDPETEMIAAARASEKHLSETFQTRLNLSLEEATLRWYRDKYAQDRLRGDYDLLAGEYYLANRAEFRDPDQVTVLQFYARKATDPYTARAAIDQAYSVAKDLVGARFLLDNPGPSVAASQVTYVQGESAAGRAGQLAFALTTPGEASEILELSGGFLFVVLVDRFEGQVKPLKDVQADITQRLRRQQELKLWTAHVNQFHQLPLKTNEDLITSLRSRYNSGS